MSAHGLPPSFLKECAPFHCGLEGATHPFLDRCFAGQCRRCKRRVRAAILGPAFDHCQCRNKTPAILPVLPIINLGGDAVSTLLLRDLDTQRVYRLYDFTKTQLIRPNVAYCVAGKVNSADKLFLVIDSVRPDTKHARCSTVPVPADGAGGSAMG